MAGVEADHARLRVAARQGNGERVLINVPAVRALLASRSLHGLAQRTKAAGRAVDRRQLHRLRDGELRKIRRAALESLAAALSVPISELLLEGERSSTSGGLQHHGSPLVARVRGAEVANRWWSAVGRAETVPPDVAAVFAGLLWYDRWRDALYPVGSVVLTAEGAPPVRARRRLEDRRAKFAHHLAEAFALLADGGETKRARTQPSDGSMDRERASEVVGLLAQLCRSLDAIGARSENPEIRDAVSQALREVQSMPRTASRRR